MEASTSHSPVGLHGMWAFSASSYSTKGSELVVVVIFIMIIIIMQ
jgi:hypothetical protein